jgi:hypothetical protein
MVAGFGEGLVGADGFRIRQQTAGRCRVFIAQCLVP